MNLSETNLLHILLNIDNDSHAGNNVNLEILNFRYDSLDINDISKYHDISLYASVTPVKSEILKGTSGECSVSKQKL